MHSPGIAQCGATCSNECTRRAIATSTRPSSSSRRARRLPHRECCRSPPCTARPSHFRALRDSVRVVRALWRHRAGSARLMRLLCTNDDGILAHGLECLVGAAEPLGEVTVVAPDREQSATSHSLTLHHPIRPIKRGERRWQVDGTPTDCVMLAVEALMPERPDFVLSGINHGQNMGEDVLYSGTVAAAMEGVTLGIPSIAHLVRRRRSAGRSGAADRSDRAVCATPQTSHGARQFPDAHAAERQSSAAARRARFAACDSRGSAAACTRIRSMQMQDPWGREIYWIGGGSACWSGQPIATFARWRMATSP